MKYNIKPQEEYHCLNCNSPIYGRTDKKYCCQECKDFYNNNIRATKLKLRSITLKNLERNHSILKQLLDKNIKSVRLTELDALGFNSDYCTFTTWEQNMRLLHCYDIRYNMTKSRVLNIDYVA